MMFLSSDMNVMKQYNSGNGTSFIKFILKWSKIITVEKPKGEMMLLFPNEWKNPLPFSQYGEDMSIFFAEL